jgi:hypothetical protein
MTLRSALDRADAWLDRGLRAALPFMEFAIVAALMAVVVVILVANS